MDVYSSKNAFKMTRLHTVLLAIIVINGSYSEMFPVPDLNINESLEAKKLASEIENHFNSISRNPNEIGPLKSNYPTNSISDEDQLVNLNLKLNVKVKHGIPEQISLPNRQGDLMVLYFAKNSQTNKVNLDYEVVKEFMKSTLGDPKMTRLPNRGVLFTGWARKKKKQPIVKHTSRKSKLEEPTKTSTSEIKSSEIPPVDTELPEEDKQSADTTSDSKSFTEICKTLNGQTTCERKDARPPVDCFGFVLGGNCGGQNSVFKLRDRRSTTSTPVFQGHAGGFQRYPFKNAFYQLL